jgi:hypothetical protein
MRIPPVVGLLQRPTSAAAAQPGTPSSARRVRFIPASPGLGLKHRDDALLTVVGQLQRPTAAAAARPGTPSSARRVRSILASPGRGLKHRDYALPLRRGATPYWVRALRPQLHRSEEFPRSAFLLASCRFCAALHCDRAKRAELHPKLWTNP